MNDVRQVLGYCDSVLRSVAEGVAIARNLDESICRTVMRSRFLIDGLGTLAVVLDADCEKILR